MADEASMADETSIVSSSMEHGTPKERGTLMETETCTSDSMVLERQIDITSPCQGTKDAWVEAEQSELIGLKVDSENDAYEAYRRYSFIKCFGTGISNLRKIIKGDVIGREFYCCKQGTKAKKGVVGKKYTKLDRRTHCKAMVYFKIIDVTETLFDAFFLLDDVANCFPSTILELKLGEREISDLTGNEHSPRK
ncbi:uncharacterized protein LOC141612896 [Silene latifolia]|uniref:uncharacterized protein LOC141612896 n=1 Tax=Silene latifolia TaxID=37657 RepID=UPI003D77C02A